MVVFLSFLYDFITFTLLFFLSIYSGATLDVFKHEDAVYGLTSDPNNVNVFASACDDGRILVFDIREPPSTGKYV